MRPVSRTVRRSTGDSAGAPGLFRVDANTTPFGSEDATPGSRACVRVRALLGRVGRAGLPGAFWCASPFHWPFLVRSLLVRRPPGRGCPVCGCCWFFSCYFLLLLPFSPSLRPRCVLLCMFSGPTCLGPWRLVPPPFFFVFPPPFCAPRCLLLCVFSGLGCAGPWRLVAPPPLFISPPPPCCLWLFLLSGCLGPLRPPSPLFFLFFFPRYFPFFLCQLCVRGGFVCLGPSGVPPWCCPCHCSVCAGWCCVVLAVGPGCPVLSPGGSWCRASVVLCGRWTGKNQRPMGRTHWGDPADPPGQWQERYSKASGPSPARLHRGPWQTSPGAMEATGDRRAGTQSSRGSPAKQRGPATQATRMRRSYRKLAGAIPLVV